MSIFWILIWELRRQAWWIIFIYFLLLSTFLHQLDYYELKKKKKRKHKNTRGLLTMILISFWHTARSWSLLTYIRLRARRLPLWSLTRNTIAKPPGSESSLKSTAFHINIINISCSLLSCTQNNFFLIKNVALTCDAVIKLL